MRAMLVAAVASALITEFAASAARSGATASDSYLQGFVSSMWPIAGMALAGVVMAVLMFRFSVRRTPELTEV
ncbi:lincomycin resistance protein LmrB [Bifidobacterium hapali]|uniref:Lincomycin resistance protein LmrB n=2 Tax=Bifidobacterium hapali TaxID=1630172 RepID=A0A261FSN6_9BIFI|nr:lincomycin resistance protein LmrB [Bifidobacterium hapali]